MEAKNTDINQKSKSLQKSFFELNSVYTPLKTPLFKNLFYLLTKHPLFSPGNYHFFI